MTDASIENYKDVVVDLKTLVFTVDEATIAEAIGVPAEDENWFKYHLFHVNISQFLLPGFESLDWSKGIHLIKVKPKWRNMLKVAQHYIKCKGGLLLCLDTI